MGTDNLIHGIHAVRLALEYAPQDALECWVLEDRRGKEVESLLQAAAGLGLAVRREPRKTLDRLVNGATHQGIVLRRRMPAVRDEGDLQQLLDGLRQDPLLLVLDGVQDPHNLGACLRTADAAGAQAVIVPRDRAAGLTPVAVKAACGAADTVPLIQVTNLARTLGTLKHRGVWLFGADAGAATSIYRADLGGPAALVMGGEGGGLRRLTRESCDHLVSLPMHGRVESLNVSVAAGIALFEAVRQRTA